MPIDPEKLGLRSPSAPTRQPPFAGLRFGREGEVGPGNGLEQTEVEIEIGNKGKVPKEVVEYVEHGGTCSVCRYFGNNMCHLVEGEILPDHFCNLWTPAGEEPDYEEKTEEAPDLLEEEDEYA